MHWRTTLSINDFAFSQTSTYQSLRHGREEDFRLFFRHFHLPEWSDVVDMFVF
jgi:hypothetical protein